jgi:hypothetical protein
MKFNIPEYSAEAPVFSITLKGAPTLSLKEDYEVKIILTYERDPSSDSKPGGRPVTFYPSILGRL